MSSCILCAFLFLFLRFAKEQCDQWRGTHPRHDQHICLVSDGRRIAANVITDGACNCGMSDMSYVEFIGSAWLYYFRWWLPEDGPQRFVRGRGRRCHFERRHRFSPFIWTSSVRRSLRALPSGGFLGRMVSFFGRLRDFFMKGHWFQWPIGRSADEERAPFGRGCPWREGRSRAVGRWGSRWVRLPKKRTASAPSRTRILAG